MGWKTGVPFSAGAQNFLFAIASTWILRLSASCPMGTVQAKLPLTTLTTHLHPAAKLIIYGTIPPVLELRGVMLN
jgi:hypothetical protein